MPTDCSLYRVLDYVHNATNCCGITQCFSDFRVSLDTVQKLNEQLIEEANFCWC